MSADTWNFIVSDNGPDATRPPHETFRFVVRATKKDEPIVVYGKGDSELEARQDAYIQIEQTMKARKK